MSEEMAPTSAPESTPIDAPESTPAEGQGQENNPEPPESKPAPKPKQPKMRKVVVDGKEEHVDEEQVFKDYQKYRSADQKFREAAQAKKATEEFIEALKKDPEKILSDKRLSIDKKKLAEKWLMEAIEAEMNPVDPRDEKLSAAEKKLKEYEEKERKAKEETEKAEYQKVVERRKADISKTLHQAMQATHLSKDPESAAAVLREMALYMRTAREQGEEVSPEELVEHIHNQRFQQFYSLAHQFEGEELIEFLGNEIVNRIRKADLARLKASRSQPEQQHKDEAPAAKAKKEPKRMDPWEAKEYANKIIFGQ